MIRTKIFFGLLSLISSLGIYLFGYDQLFYTFRDLIIHILTSFIFAIVGIILMSNAVSYGPKHPLLYWIVVCQTLPNKQNIAQVHLAREIFSQ